MNSPISIYGLLNVAGNCRYVGATCSPKSRKRTHRKQYPELRFVVFLTCSAKEAEARELNLIKKYKADGFCDLNKVLVGRSRSVPAVYSDSTSAIRLTTKNKEALLRLREKLNITISIPALANDAIERGIVVMAKPPKK
jgi:hypothetical protein